MKTTKEKVQKTKEEYIDDWIESKFDKNTMISEDGRRLKVTATKANEYQVHFLCPICHEYNTRLTKKGYPYKVPNIPHKHGYDGESVITRASECHQKDLVLGVGRWLSKYGKLPVGSTHFEFEIHVPESIVFKSSEKSYVRRARVNYLKKTRGII